MNDRPQWLYLNRTLQRPLRRLARMIRIYVVLQGLAILAAFLGLAFWITFWLDWLLELPWSARSTMLGVVGIVSLLILCFGILWRVFARLSERGLAVVLERRFPTFHDALLTTVELRPQQSLGDYNPQMLELAERAAMAEAERIQVSKALNFGPLLIPLYLSFVLAGTIVGYAFFRPHYFDVYVARDLMLQTGVQWPRSILLHVVEPESLAETGLAKVANGEDLNLIIRAEKNPLFEQVEYPRYMTIDYQAQEQESEGSEGMTLEGDPDAEGQRYAYQFTSLLKDEYNIQIYAADGKLEDLKIQVVDSPSTTEMRLLCQYPSYTGLPSPHELPVTGSTSLPYGTKVTLVAGVNKPLIHARIDFENPDSETEQGFAFLRDDGLGFTSEFRMDESKQVLLTLTDLDRIESREPERFSITMKKDQSPEVDVQTTGIGRLITNKAVIPFEGTLRDDFGMTKTWFGYTIDAGEAEQKPTLKQPVGSTDLEINEGFEVNELNLEPGQTLTLKVQAEDNYEEWEEPLPQQGSSSPIPFEIVTEDQLRSQLELRELRLRERFEAIVAEVIQQREIVATLAAAEQATEIEEEIDAEGDLEEAEEIAEVREEAVPSAQANQLLEVQRAEQNGLKNSSEILGVADAFEDIVDQLRNNRIQTEELIVRLLDDIAKPLTEIAQEDFDELDQQLKALGRRVSQGSATEEEIAATVIQYDTILSEMRTVLNRMLELEDFNEALAMLRSIIEQQEDLRTATQEERRQQVRRFLFD
ncbi:Hypothetical protein PBC10988_36220 [Planctomycetales bacterium 10988]|nr:Hypothetical protein PBC10988_36220 [Planctomycetales bacterium 10988]